MWPTIAFFFLSLIVVEVSPLKIDAAGCGQRPLAPSTSRVAPRIVGGTESTPYSWPFMCSIEDLALKFHIGAGSLIKNRAGDYYLLTTAHTVFEASEDVGRFRIWCSVHSIAGDDNQTQILQLEKLYVHPDFDTDFSHDMAIFRLSANPSETVFLQPVCLPTVQHQEFEMATVLGWGLTSETGIRSTVLMEGRKPIVSDANCATAYGHSFHPDSMLCAGLLNIGGVDACQMDSGGPLLVSRNGSYEIAGLVSWGYGCALPQYPGVYADVFDLLKWVNTIINNTP